MRKSNFDLNSPALPCPDTNLLFTPTEEEEEEEEETGHCLEIVNEKVPKLSLEQKKISPDIQCLMTLNPKADPCPGLQFSCPRPRFAANQLITPPRSHDRLDHESFVLSLLSKVAAEDMHAAYATKPDADDGMSAAKVKEQKTNSNFPISTEEIMDTKRK
ncbi:hypothetical protein T4A_10460 [Trichinella pseudospiralis]|uniref:Uncharacterized protein n=1 Tax=Trichinella pseudospiralis TaxID=6337 RepID=A0A0V1DW87_TRIPS|nr:hypothetical protein T4A_10460 [Trichinella pseudospiralis]